MSRVARNTLFNLAGEAAPLVAAFISVPILLHGIGVDRFGLLGIAWMMIGYASLFDFGIGRALTKVVSEKVGSGEVADVPSIVWTSVLVMFVLGLAGALVIEAISPLLVDMVKMPVELRPEALRAFRLLGLSLPVVIISVGLRGTLEALHRFDLSNAVRVPAGIFAFAGPLLVLPFTSSLVAVVGVLAAGRLVSCLAFVALCVRAMPALRRQAELRLGTIRHLVSFGGWMTVSNIVSPLMTVFDRFVIAAILSTEAVAYYTTSYDLISKLLVVAGALAGVLFPTFAAHIVTDRARVTRLFGRSVIYLFLVLFPVTLVTVALATEGLTLWVGADIARHSAPVLQVFAMAILVNALALVPFTLIQAAGRPDVTAKLHLIELPLHLTALVLLTRRYGIVGAAIASGGRMTLDALLLFIISRRLFDVRAKSGPVFVVGLAAAICLAAFALVPASLVAKSLALAAALLVFLVVALGWLITPEERAMLARLKGDWLGWTGS